MEAAKEKHADIEITEDDFSTVALDTAFGNTSELVGERLQRSSLFVAPALLRNQSGRSTGPSGALKTRIYSLRRENETLQSKMAEMLASQKIAEAENETLRKKVVELEGMVGREEGENGPNDTAILGVLMKWLG